MAKLPTRQDLGPLPIDGSRRPIANASVPSSGVGAGLSSLGSGLNKVAAIFQGQQDEQDRYEYANANADLMKAAIDLDTKYLNDTEYATRTERYSSELDSVVANRAETIRNPRIRDHFLATAGKLHSQHIYKQTGIAQQQGNNEALAQLDNERQYFLEKASDPDPLIRQQAREAYRARLDALSSAPGRRVLSPTQVVAERRKFEKEFRDNSFATDINGADAARLTEIGDQLKSARPSQFAQGDRQAAAIKFFRDRGWSPQAAAGIVGGLRGETANLNTEQVHDGGIGLGIAGWNKERLSALQAFAKEKGKDPTDLQIQLEFVDHELHTTESAAGNRIAAARTAEEAGHATLGYFRPKDYNVPGAHPERSRYAGQLYRQYGEERLAQVSLPGQPDAGGGRSPNPYDNLSPSEILKLQDQVERRRAAIDRDRLRQSKELSENIERNIVDFSAGKTKLVSREEIEKADIDPAHRNTLLRQRDAAAENQTVAAYDRRMVDAAAGKDVLPTRQEIETDRILSEPHRNRLLKALDSATADVAAITNFKGRMATGGQFNPFDADEKKNADAVFQSLGGGAEALNEIATKTGIVPKSAATSLRAGVYSNDPGRVASSLTVASNLINGNRNIFTGVEHGSDLENNAIAFQHYVDTLGMPAKDAALRIIRDQSPEYQAQVKAKIKAEDIDAKLKKDVSINDLRSQFDQVPLIPFTDPNVGFDPASRQAMFGQYQEVVKDRYLETGDLGLAKKQAAEALKKTWGVSRVNGSQTVMQYPPERAPAYAGIENPDVGIASQAIAAIKERTGADVPRAGLRFAPIPGATAQAYKSGAPVPYMLMWQDKNGVVQMLNPGQAFVADPKMMRDEQTNKRKAGFDAAVEAADANRNIQAMYP